MDTQQPAGSWSGLKASLAGRLKSIRKEIYGDEDLSRLAGLLGLPERTWTNYEAGVTIPGEVLLRFMELTGTGPAWLLRGTGPRYAPR